MLRKRPIRRRIFIGKCPLMSVKNEQSTGLNSGGGIE